MRQAISPEIRMAIMLHYLATGKLINISCGLMSSQGHIIPERYPNSSLNKDLHSFWFHKGQWSRSGL